MSIRSINRLCQAESAAPGRGGSWRLRRIVGVFARLLPPRCALCKRPADAAFLCPACQAALKDNPDACRRCARPLPQGTGNVCGACQKTPPRYDCALAPYTYEEPLRKLVLDLKFNEKLLNARVLAGLFARRLRGRPYPDMLIPVPLHPRRIKQRGYNQSLELARELGRLTAIPSAPRYCERLVNTAPQASLPPAEKKANVRGAFACHADLAGRHIAIIDDVMTSGHTANELAKALKKSRAARVDVWVMARAGKGVG